MNPSTTPVPDDELTRLDLRPETPNDTAFLFELYASTRREELDAFGWEPSIRHAFLAQQFAAMQGGYRQSFPAAEFSIVLLDGRPVGRLVVNRSEEEIRIVDAALFPAQRSRGVGTRLVQAVLEEAARANKPVRLRVLHGGRSAHLCERLGFRKIDSAGGHDHWEWRPPAGPDREATDAANASSG